VQLPQEVVDAVAAYAGDSYKMVNSALRANEEIEMQDAERLIGFLDEAATSQLAAKDLTVVRAVDEDFIAKLKVGRTIVDHAYLSTSMDLEGMENALSFTSDDKWGRTSYGILEIAVRKGTPLLDVGRDRLRAASTQRFSAAEEKEVLFGRGTRLKVLNISKNNEGVMVVKAKLSYGDRREPKFADE
jgi:hypothetical protein